jgi:hypothetical protein
MKVQSKRTRMRLMASSHFSVVHRAASGQTAVTNGFQRLLNREWALAFVLGAAIVTTALPAFAGTPFRTDDPEPVGYQHWEIFGFSTATQIQGDAAGVLVGVEVDYGAAPDLQIHIIVPLAFDIPDGGDTQIGIGDVELGAKYRLVDENGWQPQIGVFPLIEIPSGDADRGLGGGSTRAFLPVWVQKSLGEWTTYGGGGYWINPGAGDRNYWFAGWVLQRKLTEQLTLGGELFHQTADSVGTTGSTGFNLGGFHDFTENHHLLFSAGRGIRGANDTNQFSYYLGYRYVF